MARKRYKPEEIVAKSSGLCDNQSGMLPPPASMSLGIPYLQTKNAPVRLTAGSHSILLRRVRASCLMARCSPLY